MFRLQHEQTLRRVSLLPGRTRGQRRQDDKTEVICRVGWRRIRVSINQPDGIGGIRRPATARSVLDRGRITCFGQNIRSYRTAVDHKLNGIGIEHQLLRLIESIGEGVLNRRGGLHTLAIRRRMRRPNRFHQGINFQ